MLHKNFSLLEMKAEGESGEFTALVSSFGNVDKVGDRIMPGAYTKTLEQRRVSGDPLPIIFSHEWNDPWKHVGAADPGDIIETEKGLLVKGKLDVEDNPLAKQVYKLMKRRSLKEFSIGFNVPKGGESRAKDGANEISEIDLAECGPCLKGIDPRTELHEVKSALEIDEPPDVDALRKESDRRERELAESRIPEIPPVEEKRLASDIRGQLDAAGSDRFGSGPNKWSYLDDYDPDAKWAVFNINDSAGTRYVQVPYTLNSDGTVALGDTETEVVRATSYRPATGGKSFTASPELQELARQLDEFKKKAEEADKEPDRARSVDPLRKRGEELALEIASDGMSLRRPPKQETEPTPDLVPLDELKRRSRDLILTLLSDTE